MMPRSPRKQRRSPHARRRRLPLWMGFALLLTVGLGFASCSEAQTGASSAAGSSSGGASCEAILWIGGPCGDCANKECCSEITECAAAGVNCLTCAHWGPWGYPQCDSTFDASLTLRKCLQDRCEPGCRQQWGDDGGAGGGSGGDADDAGQRLLRHVGHLRTRGAQPRDVGGDFLPVLVTASEQCVRAVGNRSRTACNRLLLPLSGQTSCGTSTAASGSGFARYCSLNPQRALWAISSYSARAPWPNCFDHASIHGPRNAANPSTAGEAARTEER